MFNEPRFKIKFCLIPRRLAIHEGDLGMRFVGWVWLQTAYLSKNMSHGWVAFVDNQNEEQLSRCPCCKRPLKDTKND